MALREVFPASVVKDGRLYDVDAIINPTVDDIVVTEARLALAERDVPGTVPADHAVSRSLKDYLIRLNVER